VSIPLPSDPATAGVARGVSALLGALRTREGLREAFRHHEILAERAALLAPLPDAYAGLAEGLARRGIRSLYQHQARALERLDAGADVVLATPTASGKTLVYNLPVLRAIAAGEPGRALYVFPLKALERDQRDRLEADVRALGLSTEGVVEIYDGDTPTSTRGGVCCGSPPTTARGRSSSAPRRRSRIPPSWQAASPVAPAK